MSSRNEEELNQSKEQQNSSSLLNAIDSAIEFLDNPQEEQKSNGSIIAALSFEKTSADDLYISRYGGWLESRFHFRFADWNPEDTNKWNFGKLHVLNDDIVEANNGFNMHRHANQEIFSYILSGHLTHEDSEGNKETLGRGEVQFMSAGSGVEHSELNKDEHEPCRFLQTWIYPNKYYTSVRYGSYQPKVSERHNKLYHIINGEYKNGKSNGGKAPISLRQDVNVFVSELDFGKSVQYKLKKERQAYLVCPEGSLNINNVIELETRSAIRLYGEANLNIMATGQTQSGLSAHFMMIEMKTFVPALPAKGSKNFKIDVDK